MRDFAPEIPTPKPEVYGGRFYCTVEPKVPRKRVEKEGKG